MLRLLLVITVIALGADALLHNGFHTQRTWNGLSGQAVKLEAITQDLGAGTQYRR